MLTARPCPASLRGCGAGCEGHNRAGRLPATLTVEVEMNDTTTRPRFYECLGCGCFHPEGFEGDCRDDANSFPELPEGAKETFPYDITEYMEVSGEEPAPDLMADYEHGGCPPYEF